MERQFKYLTNKRVVWRRDPITDIPDIENDMYMFFENGTIQIEALTYIRGRSISNAFVIIDEAQNLNLNELIMTRNYVYNEKTYQKHKITDLSVKKKNSYVRNIYEEDGKILTLKHGYPQFYTQILFEKDKPEIFVKAVLNDVESLSKISTCKKIEKFDQES